MSDAKPDTNTRIKVLIVTSSRGFYGAERVIANLIGGIDRDRFELTLTTLMDVRFADETLLQEVRQSGGQTLALPCRGRIDFGLVRQLCRVIRERGIQILHCHEEKSRFYGVICARLCHIPLIATNHNWTRDNWLSTAYELLDAVLLKCCDRVVAVSQRVALMMEKFGIRSVALVPNGIDLSLFQRQARWESFDLKTALKIPTDAPVVAIFARLTPVKGHRYFLQAAAQLLQQQPDIYFLLVGDGELYDELIAMTRELGIADRVVMAGFQNEVKPYYAISDVFVLASLTEGTPMALLEAMAMGTAIVATAVGGVPDIISDQQNGLLVPAREADALATAIRTVLGDRDYRRRLTDNASQTVQSYSLSTMIQHYQFHYHTLSAVDRARKPNDESDNQKSAAWRF